MFCSPSKEEHLPATGSNNQENHNNHVIVLGCAKDLLTAHYVTQLLVGLIDSNMNSSHHFLSFLGTKFVPTSDVNDITVKSFELPLGLMLPC
jgi:hypothetical protein